MMLERSADAQGRGGGASAPSHVVKHVIVLGAAIGTLLAPAMSCAQNIARRSNGVSIAQPSFPAAAFPAVDAYRTCLSMVMFGKPMTPTPEGAFENAIASCTGARLDAEVQAQQVAASEWPKPGTPERAAIVKRLFDDLDESERMAGRAISAQLAQMQSGFNSTQENHAKDH